MTRPPLVVIAKATNPTGRRTQAPAERHDFTPKGKPNPLSAAQFWLGGRLEERALGYFLDGSPAGLDAIMRETNRVLKSRGVEQLANSEKWRV